MKYVTLIFQLKREKKRSIKDKWVTEKRVFKIEKMYNPKAFKKRFSTELRIFRWVCTNFKRVPITLQYLSYLQNVLNFKVLIQRVSS